MAERDNLPLFAYRRASRIDRGRRLLRRCFVAALALGAVALGLTILDPPRPRLLWNASASVPLGLYRVDVGAAPARGALVVIWLPEAARTLAAKRRYLPRNVPAIKRVAALAGARVCAAGDRLAVDGRLVAGRLAADRLGRPLPRWSGCRTLGAGELLLLNPASPASFDGRYFGISRTSEVVGTANPLWTWNGAETGA